MCEQTKRARLQYNMYMFYPSRHKTLNQRWLDAGPPSKTLDQRQTNIESTSCVCWDDMEL